MVKKLPGILFFILLRLFSFAQENCINAIDDDGDGLVDCYDSDCNGSTDCSGFFYGKPIVSCSTAPTNPAFNLNTVWESPMNVSTRSTMMVGDIDADGTPEVVCHKDGVNQLYVLDGQTGALEVTINCPAIDDHVDAIAIGDTDDDGLGEIYVVTSDNKLRCFENTGAPKVGYSPPTTGGVNESIPGIADFDQDGVPELYKDNRIYHSLTGALIASGTGSSGNNPGSNGSPAGIPVAADVLPDNYCVACDGLELVCGNMVYAVNIAGGILTPMSNSLPGSLDDGFTSVADIDMDGQLDIIVVSSGKIYVWNPRTGLQIGNTFTIPNTSAGGRANIADYDNDGLPEIGAGGADRYVCVDIDPSTYSLSQKWINIIVDGSEHTTGSVFDFDCDGKAQVVYRDENVLYIWDGETGNVISSTPCGSATRSEFPTIVDVDGDGQVNIVCACAAGNGGDAGKVKAFNSSTNQWVGSRTVMNQHSYFVTNINDDLSIPTQQQNHALLSKLNGFQAQSPIYDANWNVTCIPLADMNVTIDSVIFCKKQDSVIVEITMCNIGNKVTASPVNISVYSDNPISGGTLITTALSSEPIEVDSCLLMSLSVPYNTDGTWYVFVNDNGSSPADAPQSAFIECDSSNNSAFVIVNMPVLDIAITDDTVICRGKSTTLTASGADEYVWTPAIGLNSINSAIVTANPLATTTYTVTGTDTINGCSNFTTVTVIVNPKPVAIFGSTKVCQGSDTEFTDTSTTSSGSITSWIWAFGDGDSLVGALSPGHTYSSAGNYNATLIAGNNFGCFDTINKVVEVYPTATADFTHADVCFTDSMQFTNTSTITSPATIALHSWNFGDGSAASNSASPNHYYTVAGSYIVKLVATTNNGCSDSTTVPVNVLDSPIAAFTATGACLSDSVVFTNASISPSLGTIGGWQWDFGDGSPLNTITSSPSHLYAAAGSYEVTLITYSSNIGCADTLKDSVTVFPMPIADFAVQDVCLNEQSQFFDSSGVTGSTITSWQWIMGDASSSALQDPVHTYNAAGTFAGTLIVTTSDGCKDTVVKNTIVNPLPDAEFTNSSVCEGFASEFTEASITSSGTITTWIWDLGDGGALVADLNPVYTYNSAGNYNTTLIAGNNFGCFDTTTKVVEVYANAAADFTHADVCFTDTVQFTNTSTVTPPATIASYLWNFGDGSAAASAANPNHYYSAAGNYSVKLVTTTNSGCADSITASVNVFDPPFTAFTITNTCLSGSASFTNTSTSPSLGTTGGWQWNFGDGSPLDTSSSNPGHMYAAAGSYEVTLITYSSNMGCADTLKDSVTVFPMPVADFAVQDVCLNQQSEFFDSSGVTGATITSWQWTMGDASSSTLEDPVHAFSAAGTFAGTLIVTTSDGCKDTVVKNTIVHPLPDAQFTNSTVCEGFASEFTDASVVAANPSNDVIQSWLWSFGDSSPVAITQNTSHTYASAGSYPAELIAVTDFGCVDSITNTITINPLPVVAFSSPDTSDCQPLCTSFQSTSFVNNGTISGWFWDFGDNATSSSQDALHCYTNTTAAALLFSPTLTVTSNNGCVGALTLNNYITVFPQPVAQFTITPQVVNISGPLIFISNTSTFDSIWNWNFGDSETSTQEAPFSHIYADTGSYTITLIASNQYTCADTAFQTVIVEPDFLFYIPNAFTPDDDGVNDSFSGKGIFIKEYEMLIFDRWGNQIYETKSMEKPWNGRLNKSNEPAMMDVYVYSINVTDFKDIKHNYKGIVTLVR